MNRSLAVIYLCVALDAMGIGLVFPILPALVRDVAPAADVAPFIGLMASLYAAMQFVCSPVLGALSDRLGRRPVMLLSLAGATVNYGLLACAPNLSLLLLGRAVAGLTSANLSVATAYLTDVSPEDTRARRFGLFNAMFGAGFILGPVLGGLLCDHGVRLPFVAAAVLTGVNFVLACKLLPESRAPGRGRIDRAALNPLRPLREAMASNHRAPLVLTFFLLAATGEAYGICWALWGPTRSTGTARGSACRWAPSASARPSCRRCCPDRRRGSSANAGPCSRASPARVRRWPPWPSCRRAGWSSR